MTEEDAWDQEIDSDQSLSDEEVAYESELYSDEEEDYGHEPGREEPEPEPPDLVYCSSSQRRWYEEDTWLEPDHSEETEEEYYYRPSPRCREKSYHTLVANRTPSYNTSAGIKKQIYKKSVPKTKSFTFSGYTKDPEDYHQWERNMTQWLRSNNIPKEEKLSYAVEALAGDAYKWWLKECTPGFYKKPVEDWGDLKARMYREFVKKHQTRSNITAKPMHQKASRSVMYAPHMEPVRS